MGYPQARICFDNVRRTQFSSFNPEHKSRKQPSVPQHSKEGIQGTLSLQTRTALQTHPGRHSSMGRWRFAELSAYEMNTRVHLAQIPRQTGQTADEFVGQNAITFLSNTLLVEPVTGTYFATNT